MRQAGKRNRGKRTDDPVAAGYGYTEPFRGGFRSNDEIVWDGIRHKLPELEPEIRLLCDAIEKDE